MQFPPGVRVWGVYSARWIRGFSVAFKYQLRRMELGKQSAILSPLGGEDSTQIELVNTDTCIAITALCW